VRIPTPDAGGPYTITIAGDNTITLNDVLIGEVWLCSGQSNMEWPLDRINTPEARRAIESADDDQIRLFNVPNTISLHPRVDCQGAWEASTPERAARFSAVATFFGQELRRELGVPIGLIEADWGGTRAEAWMSADALDQIPELADQVAMVRAVAQDPNQRAETERKMQQRWWDALDEGVVTEDWRSPDADPDWKQMELPAHLGPEGLDQFDGVVYFRRQVELPEGWAGKPVTLNLGPIDDFDDVWFNGVHVGSTHADGQWNINRRYEVPGEAVRGGLNTIAIRMVDHSGPGGIFGSAGQMFIQKEDMLVPIAGAWKYHRGKAMSQLPPRSGSFSINANTATALYNGMIAPIMPFTIQGVIWYQGESNVATCDLYARVFPALITSWRDAWGQGDFAFYFVQIAPFAYNGDDVRPPRLRESQARALALPNTGMVVTTDIGNPRDIHPQKKYEVGKRLANWALAKTYGRSDVVYSGPVQRGMIVEGSRVRLLFEHTEGGLVARDGELTHFQIAGADRRFVPARARIDGETVIVWSDEVAKPVAVRFAWSAAAEPNLFNGAGLPAAPFRTDDWE